MEEHAAMLTCSCSEADRLTVVCLACGRIHAPCPSWSVLLIAICYIAAQLVRWAL